MANKCQDPLTLPRPLGILPRVDIATTSTEGRKAGKERHMASMFIIFTAAGERIERRYAGNAAEQFAAYLIDFPIGSGARLSYTRDLGPITPMVVFG